MRATPSASYSLTVRVEIRNRPGMLGKVTSAISRAGGDIGAIDLIQPGGKVRIRDITFNARDDRHGQTIVTDLDRIRGVRVLHVSDRTFLMHLGGKIEVRGKMPVKTRDDLSMAYTPGVARVCMAIHDDPEKAYTLTIKQNAVAVVTDGTAVLGLGDIGPKAVMPMMEGKALLSSPSPGWTPFHSASRRRTRTRSTDRPRDSAGIRRINLEDIAAPRYFEIEERPNVRASGGRAVLRSGAREEIQLEEVPADQRAPILRAYLQRAPGARPHVPVNKDAALAEFQKVAAAFPVFRLASTNPARPTVRPNGPRG